MSKFIEELDPLPGEIKDDTLIIVGRSGLNYDPAYRISALQLKEYMFEPPAPAEDAGE